jgi:hypothetical protein
MADTLANPHKAITEAIENKKFFVFIIYDYKINT